MRDGVNTVLFDLDGTLIDTAPDMINALNKLLLLEGKQPLPYDNVRNHVSKGAGTLIRLGFGDRLEKTARLKLLERFLNIYSENICAESKLFDDLDRFLDLLEQRRLNWGVVTNKPGWLTEPLLRKLELWHRAGCVVSGDSLTKKKPDPAPLLFACKTIGCAPSQAVYVGDDERDIVAGKAAGMRTLVALYGYINDGENPKSWAADGMIATVDELNDWLFRNIPTEQV